MKKNKVCANTRKTKFIIERFWSNVEKDKKLDCRVNIFSKSKLALQKQRKRTFIP